MTMRWTNLPESQHFSFQDFLKTGQDPMHSLIIASIVRGNGKRETAI